MDVFIKSKIKHDNDYQIYQTKLYRKLDFHRFKYLLSKCLNAYIVDVITHSLNMNQKGEHFSISPESLVSAQ